MPRGPRLDAPGALQHVMVRGIEKRNLFRCDDDRADLLGRLALLVPETGCAIYAWSLMPNHFHLLLRSGRAGLSTFMRRLQTGYAGAFNRRHARSGHLFQNRFKSILVEEQAYLLELVRYLHLNPRRSGLVRSLKGLDAYPWSGHAVLMGRREAAWQADEHVLGGGEFVAEALEEAERLTARRLGPEEIEPALLDLLEQISAKLGVAAGQVRGRGRERTVSRARAVLAHQAVEQLGLPVMAVARFLSVSPPAVSLMIARAGQWAAELDEK